MRAEFRDLLLPTAVVAVVGMMIFPLPLFVLDILLACNITFALLLIVSSVYLASPERFTSLPTILLLTTLFRLGLNISTTRQILGVGGAPGIVVAFGDFVVSGNFVVGAVVFLIITLVQFLVIAKGAERVAEVAARFALDAMPGRQMAIDADVRAGVLSLGDARARRQALQRESKLYGALDGAMKFVKGDAIAGLLITAVNIGAGFIVGTTQLGLGIGDAARKYTLLTIGDGLVSQIPALLVAIAAGVVVTRVADEKQSFIGRDVVSQLSQEPQAVITTSALLAGLAFVPGLPSFPFLLMAVVLCVGARKVRATQDLDERQKRERTFEPCVVSVLVLCVQPKVYEELRLDETLPRRLKQLRDRFFQTQGVVVPDLHIETQALKENINAELHLHGARLGIEHLAADKQIQPSEAVEKFVQRCLEKHLSELIDDTQTRRLLETHRRHAEELVSTVVPTIISLTGLTAILRQLVEEGVSVKEFPVILQAIAEFHLHDDAGSISPSSLQGVMPAEGQFPVFSRGPSSEAAVSRDLLSHVRIALGRIISQCLANDNGRLCVWMLDEQWDSLFAQVAFSQAPTEPQLAELLRERVDGLPVDDGQDDVVVIASKQGRSSCWKVLRGCSRKVRVVSPDELSDEMVLDVKGLLSCELMSSEEGPVAGHDVSILSPAAGSA